MMHYPVGTWFAVPLRSEVYAHGVVARTAGNGVMFGYFFGPKNQSPAVPSALKRRDPADALLVCQFGAYSLVRDEWPVVFIDEDFDLSRWALPKMVRIDDVDNSQATLTTYSDSLQVICEEACDPSLSRQLPEDILRGSHVVEILLTRALDQDP